MKNALYVLLILLACSQAFGQEGDAERVNPAMGAPAVARVYEMRAEAKRLLSSGALSERAWGAYFAGRYEIQGLAPSLIEVLTDASLGDGHEENLVRQAALDALIRLRAKVPADALRALPQEFTDEAIILLALAPEESKSALLEIFAESDERDVEKSDAQWLAVGNLLAETKAHGFASLLLRRLKAEAMIVVADEESDGGIGFGGGGGSGGCGSRPYADFPPVSFYSLTARDRRGAVVVAPGRSTVYYVADPFCGEDLFLPRDVTRVEYLAQLLDTYEEELNFNVRPHRTIVCKDARRCRSALVRIRREIEASYASLITRLVEKRHLNGPTDAPPSPAVVFNLYDRRRTRSFSLPEEIKGVKIFIEAWDAEDEGEATEESEALKP